MQGGRLHSTPEEVEAYWQGWATTNFFRRDGEYVHGLLETEETVTAYINQARWVADCLHCGGGIATWPAHPRGACLDCGRIYAVSFPQLRVLREGVAILEERNREGAMNWNPATETVDDLASENLRTDNPLPDLRGLAGVLGGLI